MIMTNKTRAAFPYFGGKGNPKIKAAILASLPPHTAYIEPFGGGASILLSKEPCKIEIYNDIDRGVVNFFRVISSKEYFSRFMAIAALLPYSRELYEEYLRTWNAIHDPVEQAVRWYYIAQQCFSGIWGNSWGMGVQSSPTHKWRSSFENLSKVHERMQQVQIECCDWRDALKRFSGKRYLAYCDPPYVMGTRKAGGYQHELRDEDHEELIQTLLKYDGAVVLSGYNSDLYRPLREHNWHMQTIEVCCSAAGRTRNSKLQGPGSVKARQKRLECIWRNPRAMRRIAQRE